MNADSFSPAQARMRIATLQSDVPVDHNHVEQLKRSMSERGQLAPLVVWSRNNQLIDGFHRLAAMTELGWHDCAVALVDCGEEQFVDDRIISASMHKGVAFARVTLWAQEQFLRTKWARKLRASEAFGIGGRRGQQVSIGAFERHHAKGTAAEDLFAIAEWVRGKAATWGLSPEQVASMLRLAEIASPSLVPLVRERTGVREPVLTKPMLEKVAQRLPDHALQEAVVRKAMAERLTEKEVASLVGEVADVREDPGAVEALLRTDWLQRKVREPQRELRVSPEEAQRRAYAFSMAMVTTTLWDIAPRLASLREAPADMPERATLDQAITRLLTGIAEYRGMEPGSDVMAQSLARLEAERAALLKMVEERDHRINRLADLLNLGKRTQVDQQGGN